MSPHSFPNQIFAFPPVYEADDVSLLVALENLSYSQLTTHEENITCLGKEGSRRTALSPSDEVIAVPLHGVNQIGGRGIATNAGVQFGGWQDNRLRLAQDCVGMHLQ